MMQADNAERADVEKQLGNAALVAGDAAAAVEHFGRAIDLLPTNHLVYSNRSAAYVRLGDYEKALEDAEETVRLSEAWGKGWGRKGLALFHLNRFDEAVEAYREGLKVDPENEVLKNGLAAAEKKIFASEANVQAEERINKGKHSQALEFIDKAVELDPGNALYHVNRSLICTATRNAEEGAKEADLAIQLRPEWHRGFQRKAEAMAALSKFEEACSLYAYALQLNPGNQALTSAFQKCQTDAFLAKKRKEHEKSKAKADANDATAKKRPSNSGSPKAKKPPPKEKRKWF